MIFGITIFTKNITVKSILHKHTLVVLHLNINDVNSFWKKKKEKKNDKKNKKTLKWKVSTRKNNLKLKVVKSFIDSFKCS